MKQAIKSTKLGLNEMKKFTMDEIVEMFSDPDALQKVRNMWGRNEPKTMDEVYTKIPSPPLLNLGE